MSTREQLAALLALTMAFGVWSCILGCGAVAMGTNPVVWWSMLLLLVVVPAVCLVVLRWLKRDEPESKTPNDGRSSIVEDAGR